MLKKYSPPTTTGTTLPPLPANHSTLVRSILFLLIPSSIVALILWPICLTLSILPFLGIIALPAFIFLSFFLLFGLSAIPYLLFAQDDPPEGSWILVLPLSPIRAWRVLRTMIQQTAPVLKLGLVELLLDFSYRRIIVLGGRNGQNKIVRENIAYNTDGYHTRRLDVYMPIDWSPQPPSQADYPSPDQDSDDEPHLTPTTNSDSDQHQSHHHQPRHHVPSSALAPVIVFIHPGGWSITHKGLYIQLALRLRRLGFCVVVPNFTQFPEGRCEDSVADIRKALAWVQRSAHYYGGDGDRVYLMGHGSGAHLALLTVVQDAVIRSRDDSPRSIEIPTSLQRLELHDRWTSATQVEGLILLSGIYDPIKQVRTEARASWELISTLRRALGPSHAQTILNSPSHLLYAAKHFVQADRLPSKVLLIHGGRDTNVPIVQSVLCKTLLAGLGVEEVRLRAYRELGHLDALFALMIDGRRYGALMDSEIVSLVTS